MFKDTEKTVLILGAGASIPYGYPTGEDLLKQIKIYLTNMKDKEFLQLINDIAPLNIDYFLRNNPSFQDLGKILIAYYLCKCENIESFKDNNWYRYLYHAIVSGCSDLSDVKESLQNLQIITFNYDLSLEYYLINTINKTELFRDKNNPLLPEELNIHHVYGQLYPYDIPNYCNSFLQFYGYFSRHHKDAKDVSSFVIEEFIERFGIGKDIEIMPNPISSQKSCLTEKQEIIQAIIQWATNLYVLGYGFDVNNNNVIGLKEFFNISKGDKKTFHYTNYGSSGRIRRLVEKFKTIDKHDDIEIIESVREEPIAKVLLYDFDLSPNFD